jgi:predicted ATP-grasp superfamily ATP-dependent carboligase
MPTNNKLPHAIVIHLDSMNGIQTARILAARQVPVIAIAKDRKHPNCRTRVCERIIQADTSGEELIEVLEDLGPRLPHKAVLVPCTDMDVLMISRHRDRLTPWYHVVLPPHQAIEMLMDKNRFYSYAAANGVPIPVTRFLNCREEAERAADELTFPCVLKPPMSAMPEWEQHSKLKGYRVSTPEELLKVYDRSTAWATSVIVQEYVVGPDTNLFSCNCYFNRQSEPLVTFVTRKLRQWPPVTGEGCLGEEARNDVVLAEAIRLFRATSLYGLGYLEMKRDERSGKHFVIEPNVGRPTGRSAMAEAGGVELLYTMYCDTVGLPLPENRRQRYKGVKWISERRDVQSALYHWRKGNLSLREWLRSVRGPKAYHLWSLKDPGPFVGDLQRAVRLYLSREEREKRNYRKL